MKKILNLYAGIGGNRALWDKLKNIHVTAVESNPKIAAIYSMLYPNYTVIIADAHDYLFKHFQDYDFIWSSPPNVRPAYTPYFEDFTLFQHVFFMHRFCKAYCIECPDVYWTQEETQIGKPVNCYKSSYWSSFRFPRIAVNGIQRDFYMSKETAKRNRTGIDLSVVKYKNKRKLFTDATMPQVGFEILEHWLLLDIQNTRKTGELFK